MIKKRVLSGMRATGRLHLGNYLGAAKGYLALQDNPEYECLYMVADVHGITTPYKVEELRQSRREVIMDYMAAGLDPNKCVLFIQSDVSEHVELAFYLSSVVTIAKMQHLPTFKEKVKQYPQYATMALLNYPVLMSADILLYKASLVPVGIDQEPHLEVAREIARSMNQKYGTDFSEPKRFATKGEYVPSLTGEGKMSKSVEGSYILITDDLSAIKKHLAKAPTDSGKGELHGLVKTKIEIKNGKQVLPFADHAFYSQGKRSYGVEALIKLVGLFQGEDRVEQYKKQYTGIGLRYGDLKNELAEAIDKELEPIRQKRKELEANPKYIDQVIADGAAKARAIARKTVDEVKEKMGLL